MICFNVRRAVLALLVTTVASGILATACGPACGQLCEGDFWYDEDGVSKSPSVAAVQAELDKGADVNAEVDSGFTPLGYALGRGSPEVVELLLDHGADARVEQQYFFCVSAAGDDADATTRKADLVLRHGAEANFTCAIHDYTPLTWAVFASGNVPLVQTLILYGADVNAQTDGGDTPLTWALVGQSDEVAVRGEMVRLLLQYDADPNAGTGMFGSALHAAVIFGNVVAVQALLDHGANVDATDDDSGTPCDAGRDVLDWHADDPQKRKAYEKAWEEIEPLVCQ